MQDSRAHKFRPKHAHGGDSSGSDEDSDPDSDDDDTPLPGAQHASCSWWLTRPTQPPCARRRAMGQVHSGLSQVTLAASIGPGCPAGQPVKLGSTDGCQAAAPFNCLHSRSHTTLGVVPCHHTPGSCPSGHTEMRMGGKGPSASSHHALSSQHVMQCCPHATFWTWAGREHRCLAQCPPRSPEVITCRVPGRHRAPASHAATTATVHEQP